LVGVMVWIGAKRLMLEVWSLAGKSSHVEVTGS
jgi:hypothetical protein